MYDKFGHDDMARAHDDLRYENSILQTDNHKLLHEVGVLKKQLAARDGQLVELGKLVATSDMSAKLACERVHVLERWLERTLEALEDWMPSGRDDLTKLVADGHSVCYGAKLP